MSSIFVAVRLNGVQQVTAAPHTLGGASHLADTLASLNAKISDGTLIDTADPRLSDARTPTAHALGGAEHTASTLAALNALVSDATLIDTADARLSDARTPTAHAFAGAEHTASTLASVNTKISDGTLIDTTDARLSDARTPTAHNQAASTITAGTFDPGAFSFAGSTIDALDALTVDNLSLNGNTVTTTSGDLTLDATGAIFAKTSLTLDGLGATDKDIILDRADTTTVQGFRFRIASAERWTLQQGTGSEDLVLNNSSSTADFLVTALGSVIHQGKINGNVVSIDRGSSGHTADLWQAQTFAEAVVASISIAGKGTFKSLEVEDGPIIWANGAGQDWHTLVASTLTNDFVFQGQSSATSSIVSVFSKDGDGTDNVGFRIIWKGLPGDVANSEAVFFGFEPARSQFEFYTNKTGTGIDRPLAIFTTTADFNQLVLQTDGTIDVQGVQVFDGSGNHTGTWDGTAISITKGGTGEITATAAFDALAPTTTKGDLIVFGATDNVRLSVGTDGQVIVADSAEATGVKWADNPAGISTEHSTQEINDSANTASFTTMGMAFIYDGTNNMEAIVAAKVIASKAAPGTDYDLRLQDVTNGQTIATVIDQTNTVDAIVDLGTISNLPTGPAMFEWQGLATGAATVTALTGFIRLGS